MLRRLSRRFLNDGPGAKLPPPNECHVLSDNVDIFCGAKAYVCDVVEFVVEILVGHDR